MYIDKENETINAFIKSIYYHNSKSIDNIKSSIFTLTKEALEHNLIASYKTYKKYDECLQVIPVLYNIPTVSNGAAYIILFASVEWSEHNSYKLKKLQEKLISSKLLSISPESSFIDEIKKIQLNAKHLLNHAIECISGSNRIIFY